VLLECRPGTARRLGTVSRTPPALAGVSLTIMRGFSVERVGDRRTGRASLPGWGPAVAASYTRPREVPIIYVSEARGVRGRLKTLAM